MEIVKIAKELETTVEYLVTGEDSMTALERNLLSAFNKLNDDGKKAALGAVRGLIDFFPQLSEQAGELSGTTA